MKPQARINPIVLGAFSLWIILSFGFYTVGGRLWTRLDGTIVASQDVPANRGPRYSTTYVLQAADGRNIVYTSGPTDVSLPRSIPVGTIIRKQRWQLGYSQDGRWIGGFDMFGDVIFSLVGVGGLGWSIFLSLRRRSEIEIGLTS